MRRVGRGFGVLVAGGGKSVCELAHKFHQSVFRRTT